MKLYATLAIILALAVSAVFVFAQGMRDMRSREAKAAAATLAQEKLKQTNRGMYGCCLKHPCDQCMLNMGTCPCGKNAQEGKPVCHECKGGWLAGDGAIAGKKPEDIKVMPRGKM